MLSDRRSAKATTDDPDARILVPIGALVVAALGLLAGALWFASACQDNLAHQHEGQLIDHAIEAARRQVSITVKDYSQWDEAVQHLVLTPDPDWADNNVGRYIHDTFGYEYSFVIDGGDRTVYGQIDGARVDVDAFAELAQGLGRLIELARAGVGGPDESPQPASGLLLAGDQVVAVAVSALKPQPGSDLRLPVGRHPVLVYAKRLQGPFLEQLGTEFDLRNLQISRLSTAGAPARIPLISPTGLELAAITWAPHEPGRKLLVWLGPALLMALLVFLGFAGLAIRNIRRAATAIREGETRFRDIAEASSDWIWETDAELRVGFVSERFAELTGLSPLDLLGRTLNELLHPAEDLERWDRRLADLAARRPFRGLLCRLDAGTDQDRTLRVAGIPIRDARGEFRGYRGTATDITAELEAQAQAQYMAHHDPVTGLPNRLLLRERLELALAECRRRNAVAAVLCLDLDRFKEVNDKLGHAAGDLLIKACAERLMHCVRETDTVARLGGDEFAILQVAVDRIADVQQLGDRLLARFSRPFELDGHEVIVTASIGVAMIPTDADEPEQAMHNADIALYRAKSEGRNRFRFFETGMDARLRERRAFEAELRGALQNGEFELYYQPLVDLRRGQLAGVEALVRWHHPERGLIPPAAFIQVAEETGLIMPIGEWVLRTACTQAAAWSGIRMSVNLSPVQFKHDDLVSVVRAALESSGLEPGRLELEITETVLLEDAAGSLHTLMRLKDLGVRIAMDDFGTGCSSLSYVRRFPFDKIKIDRSFVHDLDRSRDSEAIVRAVVTLGNSLGIETCAEGVEHADQLLRLESEGCDEAQGYLFCRPMPAADAQAFIEGDATTALLAEFMVDRSSRRA
jgi:diguanylate cyclase (GGDEF)-like protein/PAS domain S-box-containing protein